PPSGIFLAGAPSLGGGIGSPRGPTGPIVPFAPQLSQPQSPPRWNRPRSLPNRLSCSQQVSHFGAGAGLAQVSQQSWWCMRDRSLSKKLSCSQQVSHFGAGAGAGLAQVSQVSHPQPPRWNRPRSLPNQLSFSQPQSLQ